MRPFVVCLFAALLLGDLQAQQTPVFRGGVDLVTVDVSVIDKSGKPVTTLTPADFVVVAGKRPRRVVSADYIAAKGRPSVATDTAGPIVPAPSSNITPLPGRSFLFVVDVEQIGRGEGRPVFKSISDYLDRLSPDDRVGIVSLPYGTPRVDLTTNRRLVKNAASMIVGASARNQGREMTVGEAAAIARLDEKVLDDYIERTKTDCPLLIDGADRIDFSQREKYPCRQKLKQDAARTVDLERQRTRSLFDTLRALASAMAPIEGPKTIVLVSNGVFNDMETLRDMDRFAEAAAKSRVTLHALNLQGSLADVGSQHNLIGPHRLDHVELLDGMSTLAIAARGDTYLVSGTPTAALARIDAEMSGYYLLSFERDGGDRDGDRTKIDVKVNVPDLFVRARTEFTPEKPVPMAAATVPKDLKAAVGEALRWPVPLTGVAIDLDTYTLPGADMRTILAANLGAADRAIIATGYEVTDEAGKVIADDAALGTVAVVKLQEDRQLYTAAFALPPGTYRVKFAAIDASGRRGSIEHGFSVGTTRAGALELGEVFLGEVAEKVGFVPSPVLAAGATSLPIRVDLSGDSPASFDGADLSLEIGRNGTAPFATIKLSMTTVADPRRRVATATLSTSSIAPDDYVVTVRLRAADGAVATTSRLFAKR